MRSILGRRLAAIAGGTAITAMVVFTASCAQEEEEAPEETTTTTTTTTTTAPSPAAPVEPTEKAPRLEPGGPNPFSPTVLAPPAPTANQDE
jgi:type IV secretory pathway VirB10-like protein